MKAVQIFSGGLDSILAASLIKAQGIEVIAVHFISPFFGSAEKAGASARELGIEFVPAHLEENYLEMVKAPSYGYGKNMNPCIDCHAFMFRQAGKIMEERGASFLFSGEVLGQRPMSQNKNAIQSVDKLSGYKGLIVRPLSAKLLPETIPARECWVDIDRLLDISGRSRKPQMEMAKQLGITNYPSPAGGCSLTQENYSKRLRQYLKLMPQSTIEELNILSFGRHFMLDDQTLLIVGRNQSDNANITLLASSDDYLLKAQERPGPQGLLRSSIGVDAGTLRMAASIIATYSDTKDMPMVNVRINHGQMVDHLEVEALDRALFPPGL